MTFTMPFQLKMKVTFFGWKGLVKVTFNSPFLNHKGPIPRLLSIKFYFHAVDLIMAIDLITPSDILFMICYDYK